MSLDQSTILDQIVTRKLNWLSLPSTICFLCFLATGCGELSESPPSEDITERASNSSALETNAVTQGLPPSDASSGAIRSTPLAKSGKAPGETAQPEGSQEASNQTFVLLPAEQTGVDFTHRWTPPKKYDFLLQESYAGGGVAIGDCDGDGLSDIFLSRPFGGSRLYRNKGEFRFEDITKKAGLGKDAAWGSGCTFVDIDNDSDLDLYLCCYDSPNRLYVNQGDGTFLEKANAFGLDFKGSSIMASFSDYDSDGDLDVFLVTNRYTPPDADGSVKWVPTMKSAYSKLQRGAQGEPVMPNSMRELFDVIFLPERNKLQIIKAGQYARLMRNNGNGRFEDVSRAAGIVDNGISLSATWWDYNGDGAPDLYLSNDFYGPDRLYKNNQDGTFQDVMEETMPYTPWFSMGTDVADLNNDGMLDFMASDMSGTSHYKQKLGMGDMSTNDWFLDTAIPRQYMRNAVFINTGTGRFLETAQMTGLVNSDWTWSLKFSDLDCDGYVDLFISNGMTGDWLNSDLREKHGVGFANLASHTSLKRDTNMAFRNLGNLKFQDVGEDWGLARDSVSFGAAYGDIDNDGDLDLVVNNFDEPVSLYRNDVATGRRVKIRLIGSSSNRWGIDSLLKITTSSGVQTRYLTLARGFMSANEPLLHFGLGECDTIEELEIRWPSGHQQVFRDLKADQYYEIKEPSGKAPNRSAFPEVKTLFAQKEQSEILPHHEALYDDFAVQPLLPNKLSQLGPGIALADIDQDGDDDLYVGGAAGQEGQLRFNNGGEFSLWSESNTSNRPGVSSLEEDKACEDMGSLFFDADGDGDLDLYVVSGGVECKADRKQLQDRLYLNDGKGSYTKAQSGVLPELRDSGSCVVAADFDRDGDLDLFLGGRVVPGQYPVSPRSRLLRNDSTKTSPQFTDATEDLAKGLLETGLVTGAVWSDVDDDGWMDLLVTHEWGPVKLFRNKEGRLVDSTMQANLAKRLGWWNGIASGDIDQDGDIDFLVTNFGENTKYHVSSKKPAMLYYADFDKSGHFRIVEAKRSKEGILPVRGKSCSQNAMPFIREKLPTYHKFANSLLGDIYPENCLEEALRLEANELRSGLLINNGKGQFTFQPLPREAQVAPVFGAALVDANQDGRLDAYLAMNFYTPQRETGRMAGGLSLLLTGNGQGGFTPIPSKQSGLVVPGDAKSLAVTDITRDGMPDFVVGVNDSPVLVYENQGTASPNHKTVILRGPTANPSAIGARVTAWFDNGTNITYEIQSGSGYLSQSGTVRALGTEKNALTKVDVRWPDGTTSHHPVANVEQQEVDIQYDETTHQTQHKTKSIKP